MRVLEHYRWNFEFPIEPETESALLACRTHLWPWPLRASREGPGSCRHPTGQVCTRPYSDLFRRFIVDARKGVLGFDGRADHQLRHRFDTLTFEFDKILARPVEHTI